MPKQRFFTEEEKQDIIFLYNSNCFIKQIATKYSVSASTIRNFLKKWGIKIRQPIKDIALNRINIPVEEIYKKYVELGDMTKAGLFFGCSDETLYAILKKYGYKTNRQLLKDKLEENKELIIRLYNEGLSGWEIAKIIGVKGQTLYLYLNRLGIDIYNKKYRENKKFLEKNKQFIYEMYFLEKMSLQEIGNELDLWAANIGDAFKRWGWETRANASRFISSIERKFIKILNNLNIEYIHQYKLEKKYYDFYISNKELIIEINGDYWHGNPKKFSVLNKIQTNAQERDRLKTEIAIKHGYNIIFIWEDDLLNNEEKVLQDLKLKICK
jgi:very-short-patch-repair endonuclease/transposase